MEKINSNYIIKKTANYVILFNAVTLDIFKIHTKRFENLKNKERFNESKNKNRRYILNTRYKKTIDNITIGMVDGCNMNCKYCYANGGTYNKKFAYLTFEDLREMYLNLLKVYKNGSKKICFFGGEPLLAFNSIKCFVVWLEENFKVHPTFSIVTNGTLITKEIAEFFVDHNFIVSISLDGNKNYNDRNRVFKNDTKKSVFDYVEKNMQLLKNKGLYIISEATLTRDFFFEIDTNKINEYVTIYKNLGFSEFTPLIAEGPLFYYEDIKPLISKFYISFIRFWLRELLNRESTFISMIPSNLLYSIYNLCVKKKCANCKAGKTSLFYGNDKEFHKCHMFYNDNEVIKIEDTKDRFLETYSRFDKCKNCISFSSCSFVCPGSRDLINLKGEYIRCFYQKIYTEEILLWLIELKENEINFLKQRFNFLIKYKQGISDELQYH